MSLAEQVRLRLEVADRAIAFHGARCHCDDSSPEVSQAFGALDVAVQALDTYENPPAQMCVQAPIESADELIARLRENISACKILGCVGCHADRKRLLELGETL